MFGTFAVRVAFVERNDGVTHERTTQESTFDALLNHVSQLATLVRILCNHPDSSDSTTICKCADDNNKIKSFNQSQSLSHFCSVVGAIGEYVLGFILVKLAKKSIRSSAAMGWFLAGKSTL